MTPDIYKQQRLDNFYGFAYSHLARWLPIAEKWRLYLDGFAYRCCKCDQSIWFTHDMHGEEYRYEPEEIMALITAHVRQAHEQEADARPEMSLQTVQESRNE